MGATWCNCCHDDKIGREVPGKENIYIQQNTKLIVLYYLRNKLIGLGLYSLEKRKLWRDLTAAFQCFKGHYRKYGMDHFIRVQW